MSVNTVVLNPQRLPILNASEKLFVTQNGVRWEFYNGNGHPGSGQSFFSPTGTLYLTNIRVLYVPEPVFSHFLSFEIPLQYVLDGRFVQPWFAANHYEAVIKPTANGGLLQQDGSLKLGFQKGGGFEFSSAIVQLKSRLGDTPITAMEDVLPVYEETNAISNAAALISESDIPAVSSSSGAATSSTVGQAQLVVPAMPELPPSYGESYSTPQVATTPVNAEESVSSTQGETSTTGSS